MALALFSLIRILGANLHFIRLHLRLIFGEPSLVAMFRTLLLAVFLCLPLSHRAQAVLSQASKINVLTCSPGPELHAAFGHSAVHVYDPIQGIDQVFNFGTFDFDAPNFYVNFVKGKLDYFVSISSYEAFKAYYNYVGRSVSRQELNLTPSQRQAVFDALNNNAQPENKYYRYDFLTENCATKIPEILAASFEDNSKITTAFDPTNLTFRSTIREHLSAFSWNRFGIDLVLGSRVDRPLQTTDLFYLPTYLEHLLDQSTISGHALVKVKESVLPRRYVKENASFLGSPLMLISLLFLYALISLWLGKSGKMYAVIDSLILGLFGCIGLLLTFLNFFSEHYATVYNFSIFWANPLLLLALLFRSKVLFQTVAVLTLLVFPLAAFRVQQFSIELLLCALLALILITKKDAFAAQHSINY
jgi:hypothetical protein